MGNETERKAERRDGLFEFSIKRINCSSPGEIEMDEKTGRH